MMDWIQGFLEQHDRMHAFLTMAGAGYHLTQGGGGGKEGLGRLATVWDGEVVGMRRGLQSAPEDTRAGDRTEGVVVEGLDILSRGQWTEVEAWWREPDRRKQPDVPIFQGFVFIGSGSRAFKQHVVKKTGFVVVTRKACTGTTWTGATSMARGDIAHVFIFAPVCNVCLEPITHFSIPVNQSTLLLQALQALIHPFHCISLNFSPNQRPSQPSPLIVLPLLLPELHPPPNNSQVSFLLDLGHPIPRFLASPPLSQPLVLYLGCYILVPKSHPVSLPVVRYQKCLLTGYL